jgi:AcrR family transcriptional regulator
VTRAKRKAEPAGLSHESIRTAALALIDRSGLDDFSTRKLGRELGCEAMAIYWYFKSKDELLDAVVDQMMQPVGAVVIAPPSTDWIEILRGVAHAYRRIALEHPRAFPLLATRRLTSESSYAFMERLFELGQTLGIPDKVCARFYRAVASYVNGFALNELATLYGPKPSAALRRKYTRVAAVHEFLEPQYLDELFEQGLELHLDALASVAGQSAPKKRASQDRRG